MLKIRSDVIPSREQLFALYSDVGWTAYTRDMDCLERAVAASLAVFTTWEGDRLVGLLRCVGDGETIVYIQDVLVLAAYRRRGLGRRLMVACLERYREVRQKVLLTDDTEETAAFYRSCGLIPAAEAGSVAFLRLENL